MLKCNAYQMTLLYTLMEIEFNGKTFQSVAEIVDEVLEKAICEETDRVLDAYARKIGGN